MTDNGFVDSNGNIFTDGTVTGHTNPALAGTYVTPGGANAGVVTIGNNTYMPGAYNTNSYYSPSQMKQAYPGGSSSVNVGRAAKPARKGAPQKKAAQKAQATRAITQSPLRKVSRPAAVATISRVALETATHSKFRGLGKQVPLWQAKAILRGEGYNVEENKNRLAFSKTAKTTVETKKRGKGFPGAGITNSPLYMAPKKQSQKIHAAVKEELNVSKHPVSFLDNLASGAKKDYGVAKKDITHDAGVAKKDVLHGVVQYIQFTAKNKKTLRKDIAKIRGDLKNTKNSPITAQANILNGDFAQTMGVNPEKDYNSIHQKVKKIAGGKVGALLVAGVGFSDVGEGGDFLNIGDKTAKLVTGTAVVGGAVIAGKTLFGGKEKHARPAIRSINMSLHRGKRIKTNSLFDNHYIDINKKGNQYKKQNKYDFINSKKEINKNKDKNEFYNPNNDDFLNRDTLKDVNRLKRKNVNKNSEEDIDQTENKNIDETKTEDANANNYYTENVDISREKKKKRKLVFPFSFNKRHAKKRRAPVLKVRKEKTVKEYLHPFGSFVGKLNFSPGRRKTVQKKKHWWKVV